MSGLTVEPHPLLDLHTVTASLPAPLGEIDVDLTSWLSLEAPSDFVRDDVSKKAHRDLLRHGGFKPAGRNKPASEYLVGAVAKGRLGRINLLVDACNVVSLHSGIPISVVDLDRTEGSLRVGIAAPGSRYVFNASGQELDLSGLIALGDEAGWCANGVKDSQRTKTHDGTRRALYVLWGTSALDGRTARAAAWLRSLLADAGVSV